MMMVMLLFVICFVFTVTLIAVAKAVDRFFSVVEDDKVAMSIIAKEIPGLFIASVLINFALTLPVVLISKEAGIFILSLVMIAVFIDWLCRYKRGWRFIA